MIVRPSRGAGSSGPALRRTAARLALAGCAVAAALALTGCSASVSTGDNLDIDKLEKKIVEGVKEQNNIDVTVTCPDEVKIAKGNVFRCEAKLPDGNVQPIQVTQTDDSGNVDWETVSGSSTTPDSTGTTTS